MRFAFNPFTDKLDITGQGPGVTSVDFLTGNSGGEVAADAGFNINVIGDNTSGINTIGNLSPNTLTIFGLASSTTQIGTTRYATNAEAAAQTIDTAALTPANITSLFSTNFLPSSQGGTGLSSPAAHQLIVTNGSSAYTALGVASNGQIPIGSIASNPVLNTITAGIGVSVTNGPGTITIGLTSTGAIETLTGNSGGAISPTANNINTLGTGSITIVGSGSTLTTQLTGLTNHAVQVGAGTATLTQLSVGTNGQVLIGATTADPAFATLTSSDSSISFTTGANTLSLQVASGTAVLKTLTGNTGGALSPTAGNISTLGTGSITIAGTGSTLTTQLTGLTNHNVLIGAGTATITNVAPSATSGVPLISQGAAADPVFGTAVVAGGGTGAVTLTGVLTGNGTSAITASTVTQHGVLLGGASNAVSSTAVGSTGQVLQANSAADPTYSTATYPSVATGTGTILRANGTNWVATTATYPTTTTATQLLYSSATNVIGEVTSAIDGVLISSHAAGTPSWLANGTAGFVLTAQSGAPPAWAASGSSGFTSVVVQTFTSNGTYTPTASMKYCTIEVVGGGGGGGGAATPTNVTGSAAGGGGGGGYARGTFSAASIGSSQTVTVGAAGAAGAAGANNGGTGGTTSVGSLISATGGVGGNGSAAAKFVATSGGAGGAGTNGSFQTTGNPGGNSFSYFDTVVGTFAFGGSGGSSFFGGAGISVVGSGPTGTAGGASTSYGGGGGGGFVGNNGSQVAGAAGFAGLIVVTEYI